MKTHFLRGGLAALLLIAAASPAHAVIKIRVGTQDLGEFPSGFLPQIFRSERDGQSLIVGSPTGSEEASPDIQVLRHDAEQNLLWSTLHDLPATVERASDVQWDSSGAAYLTGHSSLGDFFRESVTLKLDSNGVPVWTNRFRPPGGQSQGLFVTSDAAGHAFVIYATDTGAALGRVNSDGSDGWNYPLGQLAVLVPSTNSPEHFGAGVACDADGNVLVTRSTAFNETNARPVVLTVKLNADGVPLWTNRYEKGFDRHTGIIPQAVTTDRFGNVFVAAISSRLVINTPRRQVGVQRVTILSYRPNGSLRWVRHLKDKDALAHVITSRALTTDSVGGVYVSGARPLPTRRPEDANVCGIHTARFDAKGKLIWRKRHTAGVRSNYAIRFVRANGARVTLHLDQAVESLLSENLRWIRTTVNYLKNEDEED